MGLGQSLEPGFGFGSGPGFGSEFRAAGVWVRVWVSLELVVRVRDF